MPRRSKGARLYLRAERRDQKGRLTERANWVIRDGKKYVPTGCAAEEVGEAERALNQYLAEKYLPKRKEQDIEAIAVADVLSIFVDDRREHQRNKRGFDERIVRLNDWWGEKTLSEINGETCRAYQKHRGNRGGARRDLEDLRAAVNHHAKEGLHRGIVRVALPPQGQPRDRWLTRSEAAAILWTCWRAREVQTVHRGKLRGQKIETEKRPLRHIARFTLIGLYTGTRAGSIARASPIQAIGNSYVDLQRGIFYRLAEGQVQTKKRQTPVPLPPRLLAHMRRWWDRKLIHRHFVEFNGEAVGSVKTGFRRAASLAGLSGNVTPHTLRHTAATWLMQSGTDRWQAEGYLGMSVEILEKVYGHHHPDHLQSAVAAIGNGSRTKQEQRKAVSVGITVGPQKMRKPRP
jgi:integrase